MIFLTFLVLRASIRDSLYKQADDIELTEVSCDKTQLNASTNIYDEGISYLYNQLNKVYNTTKELVEENNQNHDGTSKNCIYKYVFFGIVSTISFILLISGIYSFCHTLWLSIVIFTVLILFYHFLYYYTRI